jgi:hypothetical protein
VKALKTPKGLFSCLLAACVLAAASSMLSCSGNNEQPAPPRLTGTVTTTLTDPPVCKDKDFEHVWVTVTLVRAHISQAAGAQDGGWVTLVDLRDNPKQIDLLNMADTDCVLTALGLTTGLPPGAYHQIRLHLLGNNPSQGEARPSPNACETAGGYNCAKIVGGDLKTLELSSQDRTGIKIPPGQIVGGAITLEAGQSADINIDFNACKSIVRQGNGKLRLKPTLTAGQVSVASSISGRVVVQGTTNPLPGPAFITVAAEKRDATGVDRDRVVIETPADPTDGTFILCPLPEESYDIVVSGMDANGIAYNATVLFSVPSGIAIGNIPLVPETGDDTSAARITGQVTSSNNGAAAAVDVSLSALQRAAPQGGAERLVTIPLLEASTPTVSTAPGPGCPENTACATYTLVVPASNPLAGTFAGPDTAYSDPAAGDVIYSVDAQAFNGSLPACSPQDILSDDLVVTPGGTVGVTDFAFTGCTEATSE